MGNNQVVQPYATMHLKVQKISLNQQDFHQSLLNYEQAACCVKNRANQQIRPELLHRVVKHINRFS